MKCEQRPISLRLLSVAVSLCMLFGLLPVTAFAEGTAVAKVGDTEYATVTEAVNKANDGDTIVLLADTAEDVEIPEGKTLTLDLGGGYTLTNQSGHTIYNKGTLTIIGTGTVDNVTHQRAAVYNEAGATATLEDATFTRSLENGKNANDSGGNSYYVIVNHGTMTIEDVTVTQDGAFSSMVENGWYNGNDNKGKAPSVMTIVNGTFSGGLNTIKNDDYGELTVLGGTFENVTQAAILNWNKTTIEDGIFNSDKMVILNGKIDDKMDVGELTINGGTFTAGDASSVIEYMDNSYTIGSVTITKGEFNTKKDGRDAIICANPTIDEQIETISISGGKFSSEVPEEYLAEGLEQKTDENGKIIVFDPNAPVVEPSKPAEKSDNTALIIGALAVGAVAVTALSWKYLPVHKATGSVQDKEWNGLPGATVTLLRDGEVVRTATTNAGGGYELYVPKGNYTLVASYTVPETGEQVSASIEIAAPTSGYSGDIVLNW